MVGEEGRVNGVRRSFVKPGVVLGQVVGYAHAASVQRPLKEHTLLVGSGEVEQAVDAALVERHHGLLRVPHLAHQVALRVVRLRGFAQEADKLRAGPAGAGVVAGHGIQTEALHAVALPEGDDARKLLTHVLAVQVQVGHVIAEGALIVPVGVRDHIGAAALGEVVPGQVRAVRARAQRLTGGLEPGMLGGGVVDHQIQHHRDAPRLAGRHQLVEVLQRAELRRHSAVIQHIVVVIAGGGVDGRQPEAAHAQGFDVIQPADDALQITDAVPVGVREGAHEDLIGDAGGCGRSLTFLRQGAAAQQHQYGQQASQPAHQPFTEPPVMPST